MQWEYENYCFHRGGGYHTANLEAFITCETVEIGGFIFFGVLDGQFLMCYSDYGKSKFLSYLSYSYHIGFMEWCV